VLALVRQARRRLFYNELFAQGANASSVALLAFILLLLLGTEILAWEIALLLPIAAIGLGVYIARRRLASPYATAQKIDRRLGLADALSTALFFSEQEHAVKVSPGIVRAQAASAEALAPTIDVRQAIPFTMPRTAYAMAALFLVAGSLFALRYGISRRLDLKQPLASMLHQTFGAEPVQQARNKPPKLPQPDIAPDGDLSSAEERLERAGEPMEGVAQEGEEMQEGQLGKTDSKSEDGKKSADTGEQSSGDQQEAGSDGEAGDQADNNGEGQQSDKQNGKEGNSKEGNNSNESNNSLMSKVKDAVQNLLSKMKPQQNNGGQQQSGEQNGKQQGKGEQGGKQQSAKNGQQQGGEQSSEGQDGQSGEQGQNAQDQQGKGTGNSDSKQASKQPGSGVGSQDGDKKLKNAEQLAAMGKISEIIGKRSQTISGETTVEVQNTHQQLRTQYANRAVQHTQAGAEIGRDEIPVALQSYVESYFEAVRKSAPSASPAPKK
jgi:hypothetical protein